MLQDTVIKPELGQYWGANYATTIYKVIADTVNGKGQQVLLLEIKDGTVFSAKVGEYFYISYRYLPDCDGFDWIPRPEIKVGQYWIDTAGYTLKIIYADRPNFLPVVAMEECGNLEYFYKNGKSNINGFELKKLHPNQTGHSF